MTGIVERYLSISPGEQRIVRSACAAPDPGGALSLLRLYFPEITFSDLQALKAWVASQKPV